MTKCNTSSSSSTPPSRMRLAQADQGAARRCVGDSTADAGGTPTGCKGGGLPCPRLKPGVIDTAAPPGRTPTLARQHCWHTDAGGDCHRHRLCRHRGAHPRWHTVAVTDSADTGAHTHADCQHADCRRHRLSRHQGAHPRWHASTAGTLTLAETATVIDSADTGAHIHSGGE